MIKVNKLNDLLEKIESVLPETPRLYDWLLSMVEHHNPEVRFRAVEKLGYLLYGSDLPVNVCQKLCIALSDKDELVRCTTLEVFGDHPHCIDVQKLTYLLDDKDALVRGEAAILMGKWGVKTAEEKIKQSINTSTDIEKTSLYFSLFLLENPLGLSGLLKLLNSLDYRARCAAANLLTMCVLPNNRSEILSSLLNALHNETTVAAKSSIVNAIEELRASVD